MGGCREVDSEDTKVEVDEEREAQREVESAQVDEMIHTAKEIRVASEASQRRLQTVDASCTPAGGQCGGSGWTGNTKCCPSAAGHATICRWYSEQFSGCREVDSEDTKVEVDEEREAQREVESVQVDEMIHTAKEIRVASEASQRRLQTVDASCSPLGGQCG